MLISYSKLYIHATKSIETINQKEVIIDKIKHYFEANILYCMLKITPGVWNICAIEMT